MDGFQIIYFGKGPHSNWPYFSYLLVEEEEEEGQEEVAEQNTMNRSVLPRCVDFPDRLCTEKKHSS